jgi:hypothetical protein
MIASQLSEILNNLLPLCLFIVVCSFLTIVTLLCLGLGKYFLVALSSYKRYLKNKKQYDKHINK